MWFFTEEELELQRTCRDFAQREIAPHAARYDREEGLSQSSEEQFRENFAKMGEVGLLGITADPLYGGAGMGALAATIVMEELGKVCASTTLSYLAHTLLCVNNIQSSASEAQKQKFLPPLISGEHIGCMGMSEPESGSDAFSLKTQAKKTKDDNSSYILNGSKMWITNAPYSDISYVYARTGQKKKDITPFIVEKGTKGFSTGRPIHKMGMRGSPTGELVFENARVPVANRVGKEGDAIAHMTKNLDVERIAISGISLGIAEACLQQSLRYAKERKQFGKAIGNYQLIQKMIAEMSSETEMARHFLYSVARDYDQGGREGNRGPLVAAQVKLAIPKLVTKIALDAIQIHGGYGYSREFPVERFMRDNKLMEIGAGTNEVMILIIAKNLILQEIQEIQEIQEKNV